MRNDAFFEQRNAVLDYPSGGGIWNSTIMEFRMKLYLEADSVFKITCRSGMKGLSEAAHRPRIDSYIDSNTLYHCAVVYFTS